MAFKKLEITYILPSQDAQIFLQKIKYFATIQLEYMQTMATMGLLSLPQKMNEASWAKSNDNLPKNRGFSQEKRWRRCWRLCS